MKLETDHETRKVTRTREVKLSQSQAADYGIEVGRLAGEIETHKKVAKEAEAKQDEIIAVLKKNSMTAEVECTMKLFYTNRLVQVFDGEDLLEERAMTEDEFQMEFGPVKHGVVQDEDVIDGSYTMTQEEAAEDLKGVMRAEKSKDKPSLVDLR